MRVTVEISDQQHRALNALARHRGLRGHAALVQEALAAYLHDLDADEVDLLLGLEGVLSEDEAQKMRSRIDAASKPPEASGSPPPPAAGRPRPAWIGSFSSDEVTGATCKTILREELGRQDR